MAMDKIVESFVSLVGVEQVGWCREPTHPHRKLRMPMIGAVGAGGHFPAEYHWLWCIGGKGGIGVADELRIWYRANRSVLTWTRLWTEDEVMSFIMEPYEVGAVAIWLACLYFGVELRVNGEGRYNTGASKVVYAKLGVYGWFCAGEEGGEGGVDLGLVEVAKRAWRVWLHPLVNIDRELVGAYVKYFWPEADESRLAWELGFLNARRESLDKLREFCRASGVSDEGGRGAMVERLQEMSLGRQLYSYKK